MIGQHAEARIELEDVEPIAAESVKSPILFDAREARVNGHDFPPVLDPRLGRSSRRKRDPHVAFARAARVVAQHGLLGSLASDPQRALIRQMEQSWKSHGTVSIDDSQQGRMAAMGIELQHHRFGFLRFAPS